MASLDGIVGRVEPIPSPERIEPSYSPEKPNVVEFKTAKGSVYRYLPDGRTQRFKAATGELEESQDVMVFIPPLEAIQNQAKKLYPELSEVFDSPIQYNQFLLNYVHGKEKTVRISDAKGNELGTNEEIRKAGKVFLHFIDKTKHSSDFSLPVFNEPKIGFQTYDSRRFVGKDGEPMKEHHIGNIVTDIKLEQLPSQPLPERDRAQEYYSRALLVAQNLSAKWKLVRQKLSLDSSFLNSTLVEIDAMTDLKTGRSGIQNYFESQVAFIDRMSGSDVSARTRMMYRLVEEMESIKKRVEVILTDL